MSSLVSTARRPTRDDSEVRSHESLQRFHGAGQEADVDKQCTSVPLQHPLLLDMESILDAAGQPASAFIGGYLEVYTLWYVLFTSGTSFNLFQLVDIAELPWIIDNHPVCFYVTFVGAIARLGPGLASRTVWALCRMAR